MSETSWKRVAMEAMRYLNAEQITAVCKATGVQASICTDAQVEGRCTVPPAGWSCSRKAGHDGPCAASERRTCRTPYEGGTCGCGCGCDPVRPGEVGTCTCSECVA